METIEIKTSEFSKSSFKPLKYGLELCLPEGYADGDEWVIELKKFKTDKPTCSTILGDDVYIVNDRTQLSKIRHNLVLTHCPTAATSGLPNRAPVSQPDFSSALLETFFSHLFLAKGRTLYWSDLDNIWNWLPHPHNEADYRTIEWEKDDISAIKQVGDKLFVHFPSNIYQVQYTGKPFVVNIQSRVHGVGAVLQRALQVHNNVQFFLGLDNFYLWSPDTGLKVIGQDIWKDFTTHRGHAKDIWSYIDRTNHEIGWVSNGFIWAFNFVDQVWSKYTTDGMLGQATTVWHDTPADWFSSLESGATIEPDSPDRSENVWVCGDGVCRDGRVGDLLTHLVRFDKQPYLETDEFTYGDLHMLKTVDLMMIDAKGYWPWVGFDVYVSVKDYVTQGDNWEFAGTWRQDDFARQIDFQGVAGKVIKFRFVLVDCLNWHGFLPNGGLQLDGKLLDVADGRIMMDGTRKFLGRQFIFPDGRRTLGDVVYGDKSGEFELNAFGERVDLPQVLIGPDK